MIQIGTYQLPANYPVTDAGIKEWARCGFQRFPVRTLDAALFDLLRKWGLKAELYIYSQAAIDWVVRNGYSGVIEWISGPDEPNPTTYPVGLAQYESTKTDLAYARSKGFKTMVNLSAWWAMDPFNRYDSAARPYYQGWNADICGMDFYPFYWHSGIAPDGDWNASLMLAKIVKQWNPYRQVLWYLEGGAFEDNPGMDIYPNTAPWPEVPQAWMSQAIAALRDAGIENVNLFFYNVNHGCNCLATTYGGSQWNKIVGAVEPFSLEVLASNIDTAVRNLMAAWS